eukprot:Gregarina_sp_Pseudo_9__1455@NODE_1979_length_1221_cov_10_142132_g1831_i0_p1_GENE_NODE_1979_length_1221_cov_10_142132_g1831_i0NODE_1979_length_1221_cov_10_142132_g1831_i0_p1_ORF_typecomplete_len301_score22_40_NODE_1979_length_1221_cov_10_142132_g1831_i02271129
MASCEAASILVDIEKLDTFILPLASNAELIVYCSLGSKVLKSAVGTRPHKTNDIISFDSLLHFPLDYKEDNQLHFVLREKLTQADLGKCDLNLNVFKKHKTPKCVRMKLKSEHEVGIGFLELKVKLSDIALPNPSSATYCRSPPTVLRDDLKVPAYDERTQSICFLVYSLSDIPFHLAGKFTLSVRLGQESLSVDELELRRSTQAGLHFIPVDVAFLFPYEGHQYARVDLQVYSATHPPVLVSSAYLNLHEFIISSANVRIGSNPMEAVRTVNDIEEFGYLLMRISKSTQAIRGAAVRAS